MKDTYRVIDYDKSVDCGAFDTLDQARTVVTASCLVNWEIWKDGECVEWGLS